MCVIIKSGDFSRKVDVHAFMAGGEPQYSVEFLSRFSGASDPNHYRREFQVIMGQDELKALGMHLYACGIFHDKVV